jgi:hypothetical protein
VKGINYQLADRNKTLNSRRGKMKVRHDLGVTVNTDANKNRTIRFHINHEYPETKEEGVQELISSTKVMFDELTYMLGCIHYLKAPFLRPNSKKNWYDALLKLVDDMDEIQKMLPKHPSQKPVDEDDIPF